MSVGYHRHICETGVAKLSRLHRLRRTRRLFREIIATVEAIDRIVQVELHNTALRRASFVIRADGNENACTHTQANGVGLRNKACISCINASNYCLDATIQYEMYTVH